MSDSAFTPYRSTLGSPKAIKSQTTHESPVVSPTRHGLGPGIASPGGTETDSLADMTTTTTGNGAPVNDQRFKRLTKQLQRYVHIFASLL